ncbi:MAG: DUF1015 domain-containing protein [Planctomycetota bacterium]
MSFDEIGLGVPEIMLPKEGTDMNAWAVVACDQYTSQSEYWDDAAAIAGDKPSTLKMILPEVYLESEKEEEIIENINKTMTEYIENGTLVKRQPGFILVDRKTSHAESRKGLVVSLDLEHYDYNKGSQTLIRATEGTILDRLPPRIKVRKDAPVESPHIMVLIDDPDMSVIEPLFEKDLEQVYDFELMKDSGHIKGYAVTDEADLKQVAGALECLAHKGSFDEKYNVSDKGVLLYAMGDGNHSFATAKAIWEETKKNAADKEAIMSHPARYALVELVNIHDYGLEFEAIHRVLFGLNSRDLLAEMEKFYSAQDSSCSVKRYDTIEKAKNQDWETSEEGIHSVVFCDKEGYGIIRIENPKLNLDVATLQDFLDSYLEANSEVTIDYIHGEDVVTLLGQEENNMGFYLQPISKGDFFRTIIVDEALPRKTFSMGEADEKRFYLECRQIVE